MQSSKTLPQCICVPNDLSVISLTVCNRLLLHFGSDLTKCLNAHIRTTDLRRTNEAREDGACVCVFHAECACVFV